MKRRVAAIAVATLPVLVVACNAIIGTEDRYFSGADAAAAGHTDGPSGDDDARVTTDVDTGASGDTTPDATNGTDATDFADARTAASSGDGGDGSDETDATTLDASDGAADGAADGSCVSDSGACPLPPPLVEFDSTVGPIVDFDDDGSWLFIAVADHISAIKNLDTKGSTLFPFWTSDGTHTLLGIQVVAPYVYMLETDTVANEQFLYRCPTLVGQPPAACTQSSSLMTMDKAVGFRIDAMGQYIYWYGGGAAWKGLVANGNASASVPVTSPTGIDIGPANLYVANPNAISRFPTTNFAATSFTNTNSNAVPNSIASDAMHVYGASTSSGQIFELPAAFTTGASAPLQIAGGQHNPAELQLSGTTLYWLNRYDGQTDPPEVMSCPTPDCGNTSPTVVQRGFYQPSAMRLTTDQAIYVQDVDPSGTHARQIIYRLPLQTIK